VSQCKPRKELEEVACLAKSQSLLCVDAVKEELA